MSIDSLHILYTHNIRGNLTLLPRLYTFIQSVKMPRTLLLDLGNSCEASVWHCAATGGRSTAVVLDGMGFHAANVQGLLTTEARMKLKGVTSMHPVDDRSPWRYHMPPERDEGIIISSVLTPALRLCILLAASEATTLKDRLLTLQSIDTGEKGEIGSVHVNLQQDHSLNNFEILTMPPNTKPDISITAAVEFVEDEARYYQKNQS